MNTCDNARDKAIITVLYDTGIRIGELLTLKLKDIVFDYAGIKLLVTGKTGTRQVRALGESVAFTRVWKDSHPDQFNEEAWLFCGIGHDMRAKSTIGEPMNHYLIYNMLSKVKNRAVKSGFPESKRICPYKFRHNKTSQLASKVREPILEKTMGWVPSSRMTSVYLHLNDEDMDSAIQISSHTEMILSQRWIRCSVQAAIVNRRTHLSR
ncbi:hypothetical protein IX51_01975 [uncultured archaeon]|nr:hypothetical protein IX51_01975 [uncultured archaeon]